MSSVFIIISILLLNYTRKYTFRMYKFLSIQVQAVLPYILTQIKVKVVLCKLTIMTDTIILHRIVLYTGVHSLLSTLKFVLKGSLDDVSWCSAVTVCSHSTSFHLFCIQF